MATARHDSHHSLFQKPVWTSEANSLENLRKGDHVWCHARGYKNAIQHHGIFDGTGGVYHYDTVEVDEHDQYKVDRYYIYQNCSTCTSMLSQREKAGLPSTGVRFNCLRCFSHGKNVYRCEYEASIAGLLYRETGSRSTRACNRSGEEVVRVAKWFHKNDKFGKYDLMSCNCEDFARWCKIGKLGSKQVTRVEFLVGVLEVSVVGSSLTYVPAYVSLKAIRKLHEHKLKKLGNLIEKPLL